MTQPKRKVIHKDTIMFTVQFMAKVGQIIDYET